MLIRSRVVSVTRVAVGRADGRPLVGETELLQPAGVCLGRRVQRDLLGSLPAGPCGVRGDRADNELYVLDRRRIAPGLRCAPGYPLPVGVEAAGDRGWATSPSAHPAASASAASWPISDSRMASPRM